MTLAEEVRAIVLALRAAAPQRAGIAVRTMASVALPLAIGVAAGHPQSGAAASFGGLASLYVPQSPYRSRARVVAAIGTGLTIAVLIGALAGSSTWVATVVTGLAAGMASFVQIPATPLCGSGTPPAEVPFLQAIEDARADLSCHEPVLTERAALGGRPGIVAQIAAALRRHSVVLPAAARIGIAVGLGVAAGRALGLGHAYWIGLTAAAVLQASNLMITRRRVVHRLAGTLIGVGLAFAVLGGHPPIWLVVIAVAFFQGLIELVIATNYGVAVAGITVLALLLFHVAAPGKEAIAVTIGSRLADTVIGAVLALVLRRLLWPRATLRRLPSAQALTLRATSRVLAQAWAQRPDPQLLADRRRTLQGALAVLRAVDADAAADTGLASRSTDTAWPVSAGIEELARLALSWPAYRPRPEPAQAAELKHHLEELALAITAARPPGTTIPALPGQPLAAAATAALTSAVMDAQRTPASS